MSNLRGIHWKRRAIRQLITLGTIPSLFAGAVLANPPAPPGLPGLPLPAAAAPSNDERPQLLPVPEMKPGNGLRSGLSNLPTANVSPAISSASKNGNAAVNIKILPSLPATSGQAVSAQSTAASVAEQTPARGSVLVKMEPINNGAHANLQPAPSIATSTQAAPAQLLPSQSAKINVVHAVTASTPLSIENGKPISSGPVKLSIGDSGIVDLGVQRPRQEPVVTSRAPELVKPKKYSVTQPVVLAQAAEIQSDDSPSLSLPVSTESVGPSLIEPRVSEPRLPAPAVAHAMPDHLSGQRQQGGAIVDAYEPIRNATPAVNAPVALPQPTPRAAVVEAVTPSVGVSAAPKTDTVKQQTAPRAAASPNDASLRQFAIRNKPEKSYEIESRGTYVIDVPFVIAGSVSLDADVCTVFNNSNSITVAGGTTGNTRVAIASQTGEVRLIEVTVLPVGQQFSRPQSELDQVKELIGKVFPDARVQIISLPSGEIEVKGITSSESDARKIMELVRKVCLVPVHDRIKAGR